jgi:hypothetical protein
VWPDEWGALQHELVFMDFRRGDEDLGRIVFEVLLPLSHHHC